MVKPIIQSCHRSLDIHTEESWPISHDEVVLAELIIGNLLLNQAAALEQCRAAWETVTLTH